MIVLARATTGGAQPLVGGMDIVVRRNAFGRQVASFETQLERAGARARAARRGVHPGAVDRAGRARGRGAGRARGPRGGRAPGRPLVATAFHPELTPGPAVSRMARGAGARGPRGPPAGRGEEAGACRGTVSGRPSSARRARPTPSAASSSPSSRGRSSSRPRRAAPDPESNATLATAIQKARDNSMPKDNIERAIQRGAGRRRGRGLRVDASTRGTAPGGVADHLHDPHRQPQPDGQRPALHLHQERRLAGHARAASPGSSTARASSWSTREGVDEDALMEAALEAGAEDIAEDGDAVAGRPPSPADFMPRARRRSRRPGWLRRPPS